MQHGLKAGYEGGKATQYRRNEKDGNVECDFPEQGLCWKHRDKINQSCSQFQN